MGPLQLFQDPGYGGDCHLVGYRGSAFRKRRFYACVVCLWVLLRLGGTHLTHDERVVVKALDEEEDSLGWQWVVVPEEK